MSTAELRADFRFECKRASLFTTAASPKVGLIYMIRYPGRSTQIVLVSSSLLEPTLAGWRRNNVRFHHLLSYQHGRPAPKRRESL